MGSKQSNDEPKSNLVLIKEADNKSMNYSGFFIKDTSTYNGVRSSGGHDVDNSTEKETSPLSTINDHKIITEGNLVTTTFRWLEGGENVYLSGSWVNWNQRFIMTKSGNEFIIELVS